MSTMIEASSVADKQFGSCYEWRPNDLRDQAGSRPQLPPKEVQTRTEFPLM